MIFNAKVYLLWLVTTLTNTTQNLIESSTNPHSLSQYLHASRYVSYLFVKVNEPALTLVSIPGTSVAINNFHFYSARFIMF